MVYRVVSIVFGEKGLEIGFVEIVEEGGRWAASLPAMQDVSYTDDIQQRVLNIKELKGSDLLLLHREMGVWAATEVNKFIETNHLQFRVGLIAIRGLSFPSIAGYELGDGSVVAAVTGLPAVSDMNRADIAMGGSGIYGNGMEKLAGQTGQPVNVALCAVLRWREEPNMSASETGAAKDTVGGALWMGAAG